MSDLRKLAQDLEAAFPERKDCIAATLAALVAREHVLILGDPGTGKSYFARTLAKCLRKAYFEYLMTRFTEPSELFGPVDPNAFRQGRYARVTTNKLSEAEIPFLDEIFKANSAILNNLLTILNERLYDAGSGPALTPLLSCIAASNELPEGPELAALYDRLLVRLEVRYIEDDGNFESMLTAPEANIQTNLDIRAEQAKAKLVSLTPPTMEALIALRTACKKAGISCSDRRWKQCLNLIKAYAHCEGRTLTAPEDLEILEHVLWAKPSDKTHVSKTIQSVISPSGAIAVEQLDAARELLSTLSELADMNAIGAAVNDIKEIEKRLVGLPTGRRVDAALTEVKSIRTTLARRAMKAAGIDM